VGQPAIAAVTGKTKTKSMKPRKVLNFVILIPPICYFLICRFIKILKFY
jgi:hypothetical protein